MLPNRNARREPLPLREPSTLCVLSSRRNRAVGVVVPQPDHTRLGVVLGGYDFDVLDVGRKGKQYG